MRPDQQRKRIRQGTTTAENISPTWSSALTSKLSISALTLRRSGRVTGNVGTSLPKERCCPSARNMPSMVYKTRFHRKCVFRVSCVRHILLEKLALWKQEARNHETRNSKWKPRAGGGIGMPWPSTGFRHTGGHW